MLLPYLNKDLIEAGCDEAGRGCLAGSVYAAAVILPLDFHNEQIIRSLPTLGVEAFAIAIVCVLGSCLAAWGLWRYVNGRKEEKA